MSTTDLIGDFGELIAAVELSRPVSGAFKRPLFRPTHLGGKYPVVDYIVDILTPASTSRGFFFVQVKSTARSTRTQGRLPIQVKKERFNSLASLAAPAYLIGVDVTSETSHIVAAYRPRKRAVSSITTAFSLHDEATKIDLYTEVIQYWKANRPLLRHTRFKDV